MKLKFKGSGLKQEDKAAFIHLFFAYKLDTWSRDLNIDFTLKDCLFGAVKLTKNVDTDKYKYSSYDIGFDLQSVFSLLTIAQEKMSLLLELI